MVAATSTLLDKIIKQQNETLGCMKAIGTVFNEAELAEIQRHQTEIDSLINRIITGQGLEASRPEEEET